MAPVSDAFEKRLQDTLFFHSHLLYLLILQIHSCLDILGLLYFTHLYLKKFFKFPVIFEAKRQTAFCKY